MIHKYKYNEQNIVLDVNSGAVHVVDDDCFHVLDILENNPHISKEELLNTISLPTDKANEIINEINELIDRKLLFSQDITESTLLIKKPVVKALCLHIAHDCNLKCKYCFAGEGEYHGPRGLMSAETGKRALEFLVDSSKKRTNLEVDFFGGEPTINFGAVKAIVEYGKELEKTHNKRFRFTLTTNGFTITDEIIDYCNNNMSNIVLSIDGRKQTHDMMRPDKAGNGSYERIAQNIKRFVSKRKGKNYYVRGTFTKHNIDFTEDVLHLYKMGFKEISLEPVVASPEADYALIEKNIPKLIEQYDKLVEIIKANDDLNFFHFNIDLEGGSCAIKRLSGCGAGCEYMSVTPDGSLYPCHQFAGVNEFKVGTVFEGITNTNVVQAFSGLNVYSKEQCRNCWAKFYCSGGCAANSYYYGGDIKNVYELGCVLQRKRIECAIYLAVSKNL